MDLFFLDWLICYRCDSFNEKLKKFDIPCFDIISFERFRAFWFSVLNMIARSSALERYSGPRVFRFCLDWELKGRSFIFI